MATIIKGDEVILVVDSWTFRERVAIENFAKTA